MSVHFTDDQVTPITCPQCGAMRFLLHPKNAGATCRPCAAAKGSAAAARRARPSLLERLMAQVDVAPNDCWVWRGQLQANGYGSIHADGKTQRVHRVSYELHTGPIPAGLEIDHRCNNRACVNPEHLRIVTHPENMARLRKSHCIHGHPFTPDNIYIAPRTGKRHCRTCRRNRNREARRRAA